MDFSKLIVERRSVRKFKAAPVQPEMVESLMHRAAALFEAEGTAQWRCLCYGTPAARERLAGSVMAKVKDSAFGKLIPSRMMDFFAKQMVQTTPALMVFIAGAAPDPRQSDLNYAAVCSIVQNFQLLGWDSGLGMLWYTEPILKTASFFKEIGLAEGERFAGIVGIGYVDKTPRARRRTPAEQKWTAIGADDSPPAGAERCAFIPSKSVLELLNQAVWAPNDELREPWRFVYVAGERAAALHASSATPPSSFLIVVATEEADPHKREEDYAAGCCLAQNFQLLARSKPWHVRRTLPEWSCRPELPMSLGIRPQEKIAAVFELAEGNTTARPLFASPTVNLSML